MSAPFIVAVDPAGVVIRVKAVPGASRDSIAGALGDRLKVRVAAPPEGGRANEAIERLLESALGLSRGAAAVTAGRASPEKQVRLSGAAEPAVSALAAVSRKTRGPLR